MMLLIERRTVPLRCIWVPDAIDGLSIDKRTRSAYQHNTITTPAARLSDRLGVLPWPPCLCLGIAMMISWRVFLWFAARTPPLANMRYLFDDYALDTDRRELRRGADLVSLEPKVFDLLAYLLGNRERVVSREDMNSAIWAGRVVSESTMASCINGVRSAIGDRGDDQRLIKTLPRKGIRFVGDVREENLPQHAPSQYGFSDKPSIAVLPFHAMGGDSELASFADGLSEDIITELSRIKGLWVIARNTMFTYKDQALDVCSIAKDLGVRYILEGSVRKAEDRLRMTVQLIEAEMGHHVWAAKIDRASTGLFELQDDFTQCVVASVQTQLIVSEGKASARNAKRSSHVGALLARANAGLYPPTSERLSDLVSSAENVLALDPNNGEACRLIAAGLWHQAYIGFIAWDLELTERVMSFARRAVVVEEADEYAHWMLALAHLMGGQHERALVSLKRALEINPNFSLAYGTIGTVLAWGGLPDESIANNKIALKINPGDPINSHRHFGLALAHYLAFRYAQALECATLVIQLRPEWWLAHLIYTATLAQLGRLPDAQAACAAILRLKPRMTVSSLNCLPFAQAIDRQHVTEGLHKAGLPD
jgi:TolB-like protein